MFVFISKANGQYCSGDLIFEDTFDMFDTRKWQHENTLSGGGVSIWEDAKKLKLI